MVNLGGLNTVTVPTAGRLRRRSFRCHFGSTKMGAVVYATSNSATRRISLTTRGYRAIGGGLVMGNARSN